MIEISKYQFRKMRKKAGLCMYCGTEDAFTMNGRFLCAECNEKRNEARRKYWNTNEEHRNKEKEKKKNIYNERKQNGICVRCGKNKTDGYTQCEYCRAKQRRIWNREYKKERGEYGVCYSCNKENAIEGKKLCKKCYNERLKSLEKARAKRLKNKK